MGRSAIAYFTVGDGKRLIVFVHGALGPVAGFIIALVVVSDGELQAMVRVIFFGDDLVAILIKL